LVGQKIYNTKLLKQTIEKADSVILISHNLTFENALKAIPDWDKSDTSMNLEKWEKKKPSRDNFIVNKKINRKIFQEYVLLDKVDKTTLSNILGRQVNLSKIEKSKCFEPRHTIILYTKDKESYIDICFTCLELQTSTDLLLDESNIDKRKWLELERFFKSKKITKFF
jgi:hypothetical protein